MKKQTSCYGLVTRVFAVDCVFSLNRFKKLSKGISAVSISLVLLLASALLMSGCLDISNPTPSTPPITVQNKPPIAPNKSPQMCSPVITLVMPDQSGSTNWTHTPRMTVEDLKPLENLLVKCGGEIAFGLIRDESNRGFVRLRILAPTPEPTEPKFNDNTDEIEKADANDAYNEQHSKWEKAMQERNADVERQFNTFLDTIKPLLDAPAKGNTDVWGAIQRANIMLSENTSVWKQEPHLYLFLVSDGENTIRKKPASLNDKVKVVIVNGEGRRGSLAKFKNVECYESVHSGIDYIVAQEGKQNGDR